MCMYVPLQLDKKFLGPSAAGSGDSLSFHAIFSFQIITSLENSPQGAQVISRQ